MAQTVQTLVNRVRNRFNAFDFDHQFCPRPPFYELYHHLYQVMVPEALAPSVNEVLGRPQRRPFYYSGDLTFDCNCTPPVLAPFGRTVFLEATHVSGSPRLVHYVERNLLVASYDIDGVKDSAEQKMGHYTDVFRESREKNIPYGLEGVYSDQRKANEDIRLTT